MPLYDYACEPCGEFRAWRWMQLAELASEVVAFRRRVYQQLAEYHTRAL